MARHWVVCVTSKLASAARSLDDDRGGLELVIEASTADAARKLVEGWHRGLRVIWTRPTGK